MRKEIPANILTKLRTLTHTSPKCALHELHVAPEIILRVIGDPENGAYEWVIESVATNQCELEFSNCGYGQSAIALRDGLIAFFGVPEE